MTKPKYPSLAELKAQGYPSPRELELARQANARSRKQARVVAKQRDDAALLDALVEHVSGPMRRNDHLGVIKALHDVGKQLKL
jgi:hypothetical protein